MFPILSNKMINLDLYSNLLLIHWISHCQILDLILFFLTVSEVGLGNSCDLCRLYYANYLIFI